MSNWIDAGRQGSLASGEHVVIDVDGDTVAVFNVDGVYHAIRDVCTHDGAEIASGRLDGCEIICPRHGARFCLKTGKALTAPAYEDVTTYSVRIHEGRIQVGEPT